MRTWKRCRPDHSDEDIGREYEKKRIELDFFGEDIPAALLALCREQADEQNYLAHPPAAAVRTVDSCLLPPNLTDIWPRIFKYLTAKTPNLQQEVANAWQRRTREARVACVRDLMTISVIGTIAGNQDLIAAGLQGWEDFLLFTTQWAKEIGCVISPASTFTDAAKSMGLGSILPPLVSDLQPHKLEDLAAAGYMVA